MHSNTFAYLIRQEHITEWNIKAVILTVLKRYTLFSISHSSGAKHKDVGSNEYEIKIIFYERRKLNLAFKRGQMWDIGIAYLVSLLN